MAGTANYAGIVKWAQLDLQRIQHRDYVGHLSISLFQLSAFPAGMWINYTPYDCLQLFF